MRRYERKGTGCKETETRLRRRNRKTNGSTTAKFTTTTTMTATATAPPSTTATTTIDDYSKKATGLPRASANCILSVHAKSNVNGFSNISTMMAIAFSPEEMPRQLLFPGHLQRAASAVIAALGTERSKRPYCFEASIHKNGTARRATAPGRW